MTFKLTTKLNDADMPKNDKRLIWDLTKQQHHSKYKNIRNLIITRILYTQPNYLPVELLTQDEIDKFIELNLKGIIKHLIFFEGNEARYYIQCYWGDK